MVNSHMRSSQNIILTGMPGSGKTTTGIELSRQIGYDFVDFDDNVLEQIKKSTAEEIIGVLKLRSENIIPEDIAYTEVKDLLKRLGEDNFLKLEGYLGERLEFKNPTVLSTSGSLPLELNAMNHLKEKGKVIYIDTNIQDILKRLERMKTDRIIGMGRMSLEEILNYRKKFYDLTKDYNFEVPRFDEDIKNTKKARAIQKIIVFEEFMKFFKENKIGS